MKPVKIEITIKEYKEKKENERKVAIYDLIALSVIYEGEESDWLGMNLWVEQQNEALGADRYYLIIVPPIVSPIRGYSWR